ncbi:AAA family ATPase, partial [Klebsiella pneumoniae]
YPDFEVLGTYRGELLPHYIALKFNYVKKISSNILDFVTNTLSSNNIKSSITYIDEEYLVLPRGFLLEILRIIKKERQVIYDSITVPDKYLQRGMMHEISLNLEENEFISKLKEDIVRANFNLSADVFPDAFFNKDKISIVDWREFISELDDKARKSLIDLITRNRLVLQDIWCDAMPNKTDVAVYNAKEFLDAEYSLNMYFSRSVKYLGPLRMEPQALYTSFGHLDPNTVGLKGEYTAAVLHKNRDKHIEYLSPSIVNGSLALKPKSELFKYACLEWLSYLGVIQDFKTSDKGKLGYELNVKINKDEEWQDLTHVGVGVSQVLPIVIMFLLSDEDDILIFEQPELHLHPQVQSRLCDLFIAIARAERQCIIETHSEYLINRLRLRIAQEIDETIKNDVSMFFINKEHGVSDFKMVEINKYGSVIDWPVDFFDQTDREIERILFEASLKRKKEKKQIKSFSFEVKNERRD